MTLCATARLSISSKIAMQTVGRFKARQLVTGNANKLVDKGSEVSRRTELEKMLAMAGQVSRVVMAGGGGKRGGDLVLVSKPAVRRLSTEELTRVLPWTGSGPKLLKEVGGLEACTARVGISFVACSLVYGTSIEAASFVAFYWAWAPIVVTFVHNFYLRLRYRYAGVWTARVLKAQIVEPQNVLKNRDQGILGSVFSRLPYIHPTLQVEIGDDSSASFKMQLEVREDTPQVQVGEYVDVLVLSDKPSLKRFMAIRDVSFQDRELWLSENPCLERMAFEELQKPLSQEPDRKKVLNGRQKTLYLEENTLSKDDLNWKTVFRSDGQGSSRDLETVLDMEQGKKVRRAVKELDDEDLYL